MKGHDGLCPSPNPQLVDRKYCAYCNLIDVVKDHYQGKKGLSKDKTYEHGYEEGYQAAINKLLQSANEV
jgi:hypothetical protein